MRNLPFPVEMSTLGLGEDSTNQRMLRYFLSALPEQAAVSEMQAVVGFTRRGGLSRPTASSWSSLVVSYPPLLSAIHPEGHAEMFNATSEREERAEGCTGSHGAQQPNPRTALVFGREESGLTAEELQVCTHLCSIPSGKTQPSLNLSHAVAAVLAQMFEQCCHPIGSGFGLASWQGNSLSLYPSVPRSCHHHPAWMNAAERQKKACAATYAHRSHKALCICCHTTPCACDVHAPVCVTT
jgi:tRNA(Leu) C34 or U34 (ribose-2'-O)-methylase TrmL